MGGPLRDLRRQLEFAAHVPLRQIGRRFLLAARRGIERRLKPRLEPGAVEFAADPPAPIFPPRTGSCRRRPDGWHFRFLGRDLEMSERIDWAAPSQAPADQLWRMNLHYMEYLEELPDADAADAIRQWIEGNPPYAPGAEKDAWSAYTISLRVVVWMQQLAARPALTAGMRPVLLASLAAQLLYLERHLETDVGGNHLIKNVKALLWASALLRGQAPERWRRKALALLDAELDLQFPADGVQFELSPSYHCQTLADLLEIRHALGRDPLDGRLDAAVARAAPAAADLTHPDGCVAQFGDSGLAMAYAPQACLEAVRALYGDAPAPRPIFAFEEAGYFGARADGACVIVDAGPIAPDRLPAHGHGDALSFEWSVGGVRLVVDQGVFEYVPGPRRHRSRAAAAHNTVRVEGADQADFFGAFRSARRAAVRRLHYGAEKEGFVLEAEHDGFRRTGGGPLHRRRFEASPLRIRIEDRLIGGREMAGSSRLLLAPGTTVERLGSGGLRIVRGKSAAIVTGSAPFEVEDAVWWPDMGVEHRTVRVVMAMAPGTEASWIELVAETIGN